MEHSVSAVVPLFNEEKTIGSVVKALLNSKLIDEVICINDGSTDKSRAILKSFGRKIVLIDLKENSGKGYCMSLGIQKAKGNIMVFFDSDLKRLKKEHVRALIQPFNSDRDVFGVIGLARSYNSFFNFMPGIFNTVSGQRAYFRKELLPHADKLKTTKRGAELYLNHLFRKKKVLTVSLCDLIHLEKFAKTNLYNALKDYFIEGLEFAKVLYATRLK